MGFQRIDIPKQRKPRKPRDLNDFANGTVAVFREHPATSELYIAVSATMETPKTCRKLAKWLESAADYLDAKRGDS